MSEKCQGDGPGKDPLYSEYNEPEANGLVLQLFADYREIKEAYNADIARLAGILHAQQDEKRKLDKAKEELALIDADYILSNPPDGKNAETRALQTAVLLDNMHKSSLQVNAIVEMTEQSANTVGIYACNIEVCKARLSANRSLCRAIAGLAIALGD